MFIEPHVGYESPLIKIVKLFLLTFCIGLCRHIIAQNDIRVGTWRTHFSYNHVVDIALAKKQVFCAVGNAIFVVDKTHQSIRKITSIDGLSGGEISAIAYSDKHNTLIIGYQDGNIDLIKDHVISTISTIKTDNFTTKKRINSVFIFADHAYLAADFGVSIINMQMSRIEKTILNLGSDKIYEVTIDNGSLFAASANGIIAATLDPSVNILDFNKWKHFSNPSGEVISITVTNNLLYAAEKKGSIYEYDQGKWVKQPMPILKGKSFNKITPSPEGLLIIADHRIWSYDHATLTPIDNLLYVANDALQDDEGVIWIADQSNGLIRRINASTAEYILPSGPFSDKSFHATFLQKKMYILSGGVSKENSPMGRNEGFYKFEKGQWTNFNKAGTDVRIPHGRDLNDMTYNPAKKQFAIASFQDGILLINEDASSVIVDQSTPKSSLSSNSISGITYANNGLWILNYGQNRPIHHWKDDGTWQSFTFNNSAAKYPLDIIVAKNNDKWVRLSPSLGGGVFVFNEVSGKQRLLNNVRNNGDLPADDVYAIAEDLEGLIWIGTSRGIAYFPGSPSVGNNNAINAVLPRINAVPLLRDEKTTAIAIDPGNRKWVGTENGVWLFDKNGRKEIEHFNINNSPLPSDKILSIAINSTSGEVFFATDRGLVSYRGTATIAEETHQLVKIFPNPVTKDFIGLVAICGLANNAIVKITDVSGKLIRQMYANGGTAVWNVKNYHGNRAITGVYLVFSSTEDGEDSFVGKLAVIN